MGKDDKKYMCSCKINDNGDLSTLQVRSPQGGFKVVKILDVKMKNKRFNKILTLCEEAGCKNREVKVGLTRKDMELIKKKGK